jgi:hypothetical protein
MEAFKHCKAIGGSGDGAGFVAKAVRAPATSKSAPPGVVLADAGSPAFAKSFTAAVAEHRHWARAPKKSRVIVSG